MIPVQEYKTADEMRAAYKARQEARAPAKVINIARDPVRIENGKLRSCIASMEREIAEKNRQLLSLGVLLDEKNAEIKRHKNTISIQRNEASRLRKELYGDEGCVLSLGEIVANYLEDYPGYTVGDMKSALKDAELTLIRDGAIWAVKEARPDLSYARLGMFFGGRDHSTIMTSIKRTRKRLSDRKQERAA